MDCWRTRLEAFLWLSKIMVSSWEKYLFLSCFTGNWGLRWICWLEGHADPALTLEEALLKGKNLQLSLTSWDRSEWREIRQQYSWSQSRWPCRIILHWSKGGQAFVAQSFHVGCPQEDSMTLDDQAGSCQPRTTTKENLVSRWHCPQSQQLRNELL